jgi:hypothetical protein
MGIGFSTNGFHVNVGWRHVDGLAKLQRQPRGHRRLNGVESRQLPRRHLELWRGERRPVDYYDMLSNDWSYAPHNNFTSSSVTKQAGSTFTTSSAKNSTCSTGVDIGSISVSAQSWQLDSRAA